MIPNKTEVCAKCEGGRTVTIPAHTVVLMGRDFPIRETKSCCPECSQVMVRGIRTHQTTRMERIVPLMMEAAWRGDMLVVRISEGGITGYESCYAHDYFLNTVRVQGWLACAGTPGRYDSLMIPAKQMITGLRKLRLV